MIWWKRLVSQKTTFVSIVGAGINITLSFDQSSPRFYPGLLVKSQLKKFGYGYAPIVPSFLVQNSYIVWMYYWARNYPHLTGKIFPDKPMDTGFGRLQLRRDGFVSADASYEGGEITTVPLTFSGNRLEPNVETSVPGMTKVEILEAEGEAIPGFSLQEADEIRGNFVRKTVTWAGKNDVSSLSGKTIQLHFVMRDAKLYAFQFVD